ncbi:streptomycin biosynthesis protein [Saccharothrix sp. NPDC042600]|uniref:streptomycin biosynthesis protein n=1 Tax=Saccharothrix TaxID=2071 RepID=UPI0033C2A5E1|nr:ParB N-terminal domain-containing protein [Saccharothrix mutabilis subsp. capreolus]
MLPESSHRRSTPARADAVDSDGWAAEQLRACATQSVPIGWLKLDGSPRAGGEDPDHVRALADVGDRTPPIVVHGPTGRVIDGLHRVRAALLNDQSTITAHIYEGTEQDAFVLAVKLNTAHGLPLPRADRRAAADRIMASHPEWSNRLVAGMTGLAATTVAAVRKRSTGFHAQSDTRVGLDGRSRPVDSTAGRLRAQEFIIKRPHASLREIAREVGIAPSTAHDVRRRLAAGLDPLPGRQRRRGADADPPPAGSWAPEPRPTGPADITTALTALMRDPSIRLSDSGRFLLRWLRINQAGMADRERILQTVPGHCADIVAMLARSYAGMWAAIAARLDEDHRRSWTPPAPRRHEDGPDGQHRCS